MVFFITGSTGSVNYKYNSAPAPFGIIDFDFVLWLSTLWF